MENESGCFTNYVAKIIRNRIDVDIILIYKSFKFGRYFQFNFSATLALCSKAIYIFT